MANTPRNNRRQPIVIKPAAGWRMVNLSELWAYRELLWVLVDRDVKVRYKQTVLGVAWAVLKPVTTMIIFTVIFGGLAKIPSGEDPYPVFVFAALLPWNFFATSLGMSSSSLVSSTALVSKVYFPRLIIPLASVGGSLVDLVISTVILFGLMLIYGVGLTPQLVLAPFFVLVSILATFGVGTFLSALTVAYRDFKYIVPFLVQVWMYLTPVIYPLDLAPERWRWLFYFNPMTGVVEGFRFSFLGQPPDYLSFVSSFLISILFFLVGIAYFERVERRFADII